jgi:RNA polymerase sigma factor (TIGR02999 family)
MAEPGDITRLLRQTDEGDRAAADELYALVQDDLKAIARKRKRHMSPRDDASTTLLVDEAFMRLSGQGVTTWNAGDRRKFFGYAAKKIHEMLIKAARAEATAKRGGGRDRMLLDDDVMCRQGRGEDLGVQLDLKEALDRFEIFAPDDALLFRVRYYLGCTFEEASGVLGISSSEAKRAFERARHWLGGQLKEYGLDA